MSYITKSEKASEKRKEVMEAIEKAAAIVCSTMGPGGRNVTIHSDKGISTIKDGVTVARHLNFEGKVENMVSLMAVDAAYRTVKEVGDGTTTSILLLHAIYKALMGHVKQAESNGYSPNLFKVGKGVDMAVEVVREYLNGMAIPIKNEHGEIDREMLRDVSVISANNDEILGRMIADIVYQVGENGFIEVKDSIDGSTYSVKTDGYVFDTISLKQFFDPGKGSVELTNPLIFIADIKISDYDEIRHVISTWRSNCKKDDGTYQPLLMIVGDIEGSALSSLTVNSRNMPIVVVKAPGFGESRKDLLEDIQMFTDTRQVFNEIRGVPLKRFGIGMESDLEREFGRADKVTIYKDKVIIANDKEMERWNLEGSVSSLIDSLKGLVLISESESEKGWLKERITRLSSGVGTIYVGADSELELGFKRMVIDDAQRACFTALDGGIVVGAGYALAKCKATLDEAIDKIHSGASKLSMQEHGVPFPDEVLGMLSVRNALNWPMWKIMENLFFKYEEIERAYELAVTECSDTINGWRHGFDYQSMGMVDLIDEGVIDPVKVTTSALKNAASVAKQLLTTEYFLFLESQKDMDLGKIFYPDR